MTFHRITALVLAVALACCSEAERDPAPSTAPPPAPATPVATSTFGLYLLALSWAPSFCCTHRDKEECRGLDSAYAGTHLTLHGLWPNFTDAEAHGRATYPQFCGRYERCRSTHDARCEPDVSAIPDEMRELGPGYIGDDHFLARHEWPKHGGCTKLDAPSYFRAALDAMKRLPGGGTPDLLRGAIDGDVALADLQGAFGVPASSVLLACDAHCRLSQVSICLAHDARDLPTTATPCPANTTNAEYDNGCVVRGCERIAVSAAGNCRVRDPDDPRPQRSRNDPPRRPGERACNKPGQGPSCTSDAQCTKQGYLRCARSGCCTSQP